MYKSVSSEIIISEFSILTLTLSKRNHRVATFSFLLMQTMCYGPNSIMAFSSICPTESLRILGLFLWEKVTQPLLYAVGNVFFSHGRKSV